MSKKMTVVLPILMLIALPNFSDILVNTQWYEYQQILFFKLKVEGVFRVRFLFVRLFSEKNYNLYDFNNFNGFI